MEESKSASELSRRVAFEIEVQMLRRDRMTQVQLAQRAGLPQPYISRRLTGQVEFTLKDLETIARALDVEVSALLPTPTRVGIPDTAGYATEPAVVTGQTPVHSDRPHPGRPPTRHDSTAPTSHLRRPVRLTHRHGGSGT